MTCTYIYDIKKIKSTNNRVFVRVLFASKKGFNFWMSKKQYAQLTWCMNQKQFNYSKTEILGVFQENRFIWSGIKCKHRNDKNYLMAHFKAKWVDRIELTEKEIRHVPKKIDPIKSKPEKKLLR